MLLVHEGGESPGVARSVVTVGVFDGVHVGHQRLLTEARSLADANGGPLVVVLFDRHPDTVTHPETAPPLLSDLRQRIELLDDLGVDVTYVLRFDEERSLEPPEDFVREVLAGFLDAAVYISGEDHHFGHRAKGDIALVGELGAGLGLKVVAVPLLRGDDGEPVSSTLVRRVLTGGDVAATTPLLGHPFELRGVVEHGDARGRTIGFPTANVAVAGDMALPKDGVFAGWYIRPSGEEHPAAINIGRRPTFYDENGLLLVEAHLLDFDGDLYGERPRVRFAQRLRDEVRFDGLESLKAQLRKDVEKTRQLLPR
jgi:riboflavin kinase/FMN adenylyltransferase